MSADFEWLGQLLRMAVDPRLSLDAFREHVAGNERLEVEIVRICNTPLFEMEGRISRLERAVLILGQGVVASVATGILVRDRIRSLELEPDETHVMWLHALGVAVGAEGIARSLGRIRPTLAHCAGLLHDLGVIELRNEYGTRHGELVARSREERVPLEDLEREVLGETHSARLAASVGSWRLPSELEGVFAAHHHPLDAPHESRSLAAAIHAAHAIAPSIGWSEVVDEGLTRLEELGLLPDEAAALSCETERHLKETAAAYD